ncbi:hypothetical protein FRB99_000993 [Tulasnella sp. 403]|nr:hypothetical protein FRB99_000993 [Tulasnella sp. 403]
MSTIAPNAPHLDTAKNIAFRLLQTVLICTLVSISLLRVLIELFVIPHSPGSTSTSTSTSTAASASSSSPASSSSSEKAASVANDSSDSETNSPPPPKLVDISSPTPAHPVFEEAKTSKPVSSSNNNTKAAEDSWKQGIPPPPSSSKNKGKEKAPPMFEAPPEFPSQGPSYEPEPNEDFEEIKRELPDIGISFTDETGAPSSRCMEMYKNIATVMVPCYATGGQPPMDDAPCVNMDLPEIDVKRDAVAIIVAQRAMELKRQYDAKRNLAALNRSIHLYEHALALNPGDEEVVASLILPLADNLFDRFKRNNTMEDLDNAVTQLQLLVNILPKDHKLHQVALHQLSRAFEVQVRLVINALLYLTIVPAFVALGCAAATRYACTRVIRYIDWVENIITTKQHHKLVGEWLEAVGRKVLKLFGYEGVKVYYHNNTPNGRSGWSEIGAHSSTARPVESGVSSRHLFPLGPHVRGKNGSNRIDSVGHLNIEQKVVEHIDIPNGSTAATFAGNILHNAVDDVKELGEKIGEHIPDPLGLRNDDSGRMGNGSELGQGVKNAVNDSKDILSAIKTGTPGSFQDTKKVLDDCYIVKSAAEILKGDDGIPVSSAPPVVQPPTKQGKQQPIPQSGGTVDQRPKYHFDCNCGAHIVRLPSKLDILVTLITDWDVFKANILRFLEGTLSALQHPQPADQSITLQDNPKRLASPFLAFKWPKGFSVNPKCVTAHNADIEREVLFVTSAFDANMLGKIAAFRLNTMSKDQGWCIARDQGSWSWFEVGIINDGSVSHSATEDSIGPIETKRNASTGQVLRWTSHHNEIAREAFKRHAGEIFGHGHEMWRHLEPGDRLAVWMCARFSASRCEARSAELVVWEHI